jgi:ribosomal protein S18 acetylase RimI-like enzyme
MSYPNSFHINDEKARECHEFLSKLPTSTRGHPHGGIDPSLLTDDAKASALLRRADPRRHSGREQTRDRHQPLESRIPSEHLSPRPRRIDRKMALLTRSGLFGSDTRRARISRAATVEDLRDAYRLVHDVYLGAEYISTEPARMRIRIFETSPRTATFIAKVQGRVVGVLSIIHDSEGAGLPSDSAFPEELKVRREAGLKLVEVTNQAVDPEYRRTAVPTELMRCAFAHAMNEGADQGIAAVSPSHNAFYELLGFRQIGHERSYSDKINDPVVPVMIDLNKHRRPRNRMNRVQKFMFNFMTGHNPYFGYVGAWAAAARELFLDHHLLSRLFVEERNFVDECSPEHLQALHEHWGADLFAKVKGECFLPDTAEFAAPITVEVNPVPTAAEPEAGNLEKFLERLRENPLRAALPEHQLPVIAKSDEPGSDLHIVSDTQLPHSPNPPPKSGKSLDRAKSGPPTTTHNANLSSRQPRPGRMHCNSESLRAA